MEVYEQFHSFNFLENEQFMEGWRAIENKIQTAEKREEKLVQAKIFFFSKFHRPVSLEKYKQWLKTRGENIQSSNSIPGDREDEKETTLNAESQGASVTHVNKLEINKSPKSENTGTAVSIPVLKQDGDYENVEILNASSQLSDLSVTEGACSPLNADGNKTNQLTELSIKTTDNTKLNSSTVLNTQTIEDNSTTEPLTVSNKESADGSNQALSFGHIMELVEKGLPIPGVEELNVEPTNTEPTESRLKRVKKPWEKEQLT